MIVQISNVHFSNMEVFLQPPTNTTYGVQENKKEFFVDSNVTVEVPSDWQVWIVYEPRIMGGNFTVKTWVTYYLESDISRI